MARGQRATAAAKPARTRRAAPEPEPEPEESGKDFTAYADKEPTATMSDFADWLIAEVYEDDLGDIDEDSFREAARLGPTLYHYFQASDFNKQRKAERAAEREEVEDSPPPTRRGRAKPEPEPEPEDLEEPEEPEEEPEEEEEQPKPARRARTAKPAASAPRRGAPTPPGKPAARTADRPVRGRGRSRTSDEAPY